ncbi:MAG: NAD(P)H-dependent oxidoreductase subunit E [Polyangiaceae bacterium]
MDLRALERAPSEAERAAIDAVLGPRDDDAPIPLGAARRKRHLLLPALHAVQARVGWVSPGALGYICERLHVPPAEGFGVASFYALFALTERPRVALHVCDDVACKLAGADAIVTALERSDGDRARAQWHRSPCLGMCERAPAALWTRAGEEPKERLIGELALDQALALSNGGEPPEIPDPALPQAGESGLRLLARAGVVDPSSLMTTERTGATERSAERWSSARPGSSASSRSRASSDVEGRRFPLGESGKAWRARPAVLGKYVVCNADESEPGTFKDRVLMERDPFALIEAMTIAGVTVGAEHGYLYVRAEYPRATERLAHAIRVARARGVLGADLLGRGRSFDIELRRGAGAYICGEETALFASIEGFRGEPRTKPPFPVEAGLFGRPTVVNNVETLANVPFIVEHGAKAYRALGTDGSPGTRLFCVSGRVVRPGIYELPFGVSLGELLEKAGGVSGGRSLAGILLGGAAGTFVGPSSLGLPLTFEDSRKAGVTLGSGVVLVLDDTVEIPALLARIAAFFRDESCGQCVPCRVGTVRQEELISRLNAGAPRGGLEQELALLADLGRVMRDASICGLGQTASSAIESAVANLGAYQGRKP